MDDEGVTQLLRQAEMTVKIVLLECERHFFPIVIKARLSQRDDMEILGRHANHFVPVSWLRLSGVGRMNADGSQNPIILHS